MVNRGSANLQVNFFRSLNTVIEPLVRAGFASPLCSPTGLIVLETRGRKTGRAVNIPLMATRIGRFIAVGTFRSDSQWIKNLQADSQVRYWIGGKLQEATAVMMTDESVDAELEKLPQLMKNLVNAQRQTFAMFGGNVAILMPRD